MAVVAWRRVRESLIFGSVMVHTTPSEKPLRMLGFAQNRETCAGFSRLKLPQAAVKSTSMEVNLAEFARAPVRNTSRPCSKFHDLTTSTAWDNCRVMECRMQHLKTNRFPRRGIETRNSSDGPFSPILLKQGTRLIL